MGKHLPAIDGLRAFAVLSVVAYHAGLPVPAGYVGVDVFFVISGFVITRMLLSEPIDLAAFYARRVRRILPALVVVVASTLALSAAMLPADLQIATNRSAIAAMGMGANVWFQFHTGYFDGAADQMPLLHLWSLGVEEQFYLLWPLLILKLNFVSRPSSKVYLLALLAAGSLVASELFPALAFYQMPLRFWELAAGGLVVMLPTTRLPVAPVGLLLLVCGVLFPSAAFPGLGAAIPVLGSVLVLHAIHSGGRIRVLEMSGIRYIGLVSYSFYLWHWPLLAIHKASSLEPPSLSTNLALCALAFVLAALSYRFVEQPFRRSQAPKFRAIGLGVGTCVVMAGCAAAVGATVPERGLKPSVPRECYQTHQDAPALPPLSCGRGDVILWGDSHAQAWRPFADRFGPVYQLTRTGCTPSTLPAKPKHLTEAETRKERVAGTLHRSEGCAEFNALVLPEAKRGKVVILSTRWLGGIDTPEDALAGIASVLDALETRVIVMGPLPVMPPCRGRVCAMARTDFDTQADPIRAKLRALVSKHPNAEFVDPTDYFCDAEACPSVKDGVPLYFDDNHVSAQAAAAAFTRR